MAFKTGIYSLGICLALFFSGSSGAEERVDTDTLRVAMDSDIRSTDAGVKRDGNTDTVLHHILEGLVAYRDDLTIAPMLAQSYDVTDEGRTYTFNLRRGVTFHNGAALTSDHVKWSWQRYLDPKTGWKCRSWYDGTGTISVRITSIENPDPYTVIFRLAQPSYIFLHRMAHLQCITAILHPSSVDDNGDWIEPVATGPYKLKEWRRGEYIDLVRFEDYRPSNQPASGLAGRKIALADHIRFLIIPDASIAKAALMAGDIDVTVSLPLSLHGELASQSALNLVVQPTLNWMTLLVQPNAPTVSNTLIRQAIAYAIDRKALAKFATQGFGEANSAAVPVQSPYYDASYADWYAYDPVKAKALLQEAGYQGEAVKIQTNRKHAHLYEGAIIMHAMLRAIGMNAELEVVDWATQLNNFYSGDFQLSAFDYSARTEPFLNYSLVARKRGGGTPFGWDNPVVTETLQKLDLVFDREERASLFKMLHRELKQDIPIIGLYNIRKLVALDQTVKGFEGWRLDKPRFWGVSKVSQLDKAAMLAEDAP